jgi:hypothetical protein
MVEIMTRIELREDKPKDAAEMELAIDGEFQSIKVEAVREILHDKLVKLYSSMLVEFGGDRRSGDAAMAEAWERTHRYTQREAFQGILNLMEVIAAADDRYFDDRNIATRRLAQACVWAVCHLDKIPETAFNKPNQKENR